MQKFMCAPSLCMFTKVNEKKILKFLRCLLKCLFGVWKFSSLLIAAAQFNFDSQLLTNFSFLSLFSDPESL